jgi:hypothetical protein
VARGERQRGLSGYASPAGGIRYQSKDGCWTVTPISLSLADVDRLARHYTGHPYRQRDRGRISAWIAVEGWHGWGALKDNSNQPG